ncbi:MAG TPA: hypothetical protein PKI62_04495 [bacterium]|nr:hypothetical protein [bacterium]
MPAPRKFPLLLWMMALSCAAVVPTSWRAADFAALSCAAAAPFSWTAADFAALNQTHDLSLPAWGPYTKKYIGLSHIPDAQQGLRFDVGVFPGLYRRKVALPNVFFESDYHPWEASPQFEYFSFRHELEWQDRVYTDISYSEIDPQARLVRIECVNNTGDKQNLAIHFLASMHFPSIREYSPDTPILLATVQLPPSGVWIDALPYREMEFAHPRPQDNLGYDGKFRGEIRDHGFVNGTALGAGFGAEAGDHVTYAFTTTTPLSDALLVLRYRLAADSSSRFHLGGLLDREVALAGGAGMQLCRVPLGSLVPGRHELTLLARGGSAIDLDGFALLSAAEAGGLTFGEKKWQSRPERLAGPVPQSLLLKYADTALYYGLAWDFPMSQVREWRGRDIDTYFKRMVNDHVPTEFTIDGDEEYTNVFLRPVNLTPQSRRVLYGMVCCGTRQEVEMKLRQYSATAARGEEIYARARAHVVDLDFPGEGDPYLFSQMRMSATTLCNVVYPVYTQGQYIRHNTPGRWWDCLYTWDSGFIGMGLLQLDERRAIECLNTYTTPPGAQSAFLHHGTPVPVQHYLFLELWQRSQSMEMLRYFYPRLKQYHEFLAGRLGSSTTAAMKSHLLKTWDYFYNSGGWDDYPPQKYVHDRKLEAGVTPVITTAQVIRTARILEMAARQLGLEADVRQYEADIKRLTAALQKYAWDPESGYFAYVMHDAQGRPVQQMRYEERVNYDMGMDGAYPLVAGACTPEQERLLLERLESPQHLWSPIGLSAVDQSAPYYRMDGYWNGTVWIAHQWFFWKTMLDLGRADFAFQIARTGLDLWKKEVENSYNCMEHFLIETGRGAGWHEFGGLSTPVLLWYSAYFRPGTFTCGLDGWVESQAFGADNRSYTATLKFYGRKRTTAVVACLDPGRHYRATWNGQPLECRELARGTLSLLIPVEPGQRGTLNITPVAS